MDYCALGLMSGSSLDGLDIVLAGFQKNDDHWSYHIIKAGCTPYPQALKKKLRDAYKLNARDYLLFHTAYGRYCGEQVVEFLTSAQPPTKVDVIGSHGHTTFHLPEQRMTHQIGDGASIAAATGIPVVSDLRSVDVALGGQGAPIVPIGEKLLFNGYSCFLNIGGIANLSVHTPEKVIAFDVCPANRMLNMLALRTGAPFDQNGQIAAAGRIDDILLNKLNDQDYYSRLFPKSLANSFGDDTISHILAESSEDVEDKLATYCEHIAFQIGHALRLVSPGRGRMLVTGGGALNTFLMQRIASHLHPLGMEAVVPDVETVQYKEAMIMAFMAVLRLRGEENVFCSVTGASQNSSNGALWQ